MPAARTRGDTPQSCNPAGFPGRQEIRKLYVDGQAIRVEFFYLIGNFVPY